MTEIKPDASNSTNMPVDNRGHSTTAKELAIKMHSPLVDTVGLG